MVSDKKIFSCFSLYEPSCIRVHTGKTCDPQGGAIFGPRGIILTILVEDFFKFHLENLFLACVT